MALARIVWCWFYKKIKFPPIERSKFYFYRCEYKFRIYGIYISYNTFFVLFKYLEYDRNVFAVEFLFNSGYLSKEWNVSVRLTVVSRSNRSRQMGIPRNGCLLIFQLQSNSKPVSYVGCTYVQYVLLVWTYLQVIRGRKNNLKLSF